MINILENIENTPIIVKDLMFTTTRLYSGDGYVDFESLFTINFKRIPCRISRDNIDCRKANNWFGEKYGNSICELFYTKGDRCRRKSTSFEYDDIYYVMTENMMIHFDITCSTYNLLYLHSDASKADEIVNGISQFKLKKTAGKPKINLLINTMHGIDTRTLEIVKPKLNIEDNYNDDFMEVHQTILKRLMRKNDKGLTLLHGKPGTGKTSYIRYLICKLQKDVIFLPPNMACAITNPELMSVLIDNPNSVFVIEDAENIIIDREQNGNSPVSTLLNLADGLLSDCLNIQIICSFNTDITKVDSALMRKGRLIAKYEFTELQTVKAQALSDKLGFKSNIDKPMTLAAIYNQEDRDFQPASRKKIGFAMI